MGFQRQDYIESHMSATCVFSRAVLRGSRIALSITRIFLDWARLIHTTSHLDFSNNRASETGFNLVQA
jgi:hypothetical protein